jgi:hypothetical protein
VSRETIKEHSAIRLDEDFSGVSFPRVSLVHHSYGEAIIELMKCISQFRGVVMATMLPKFFVFEPEGCGFNVTFEGVTCCFGPDTGVSHNGCVVA